MINVLHIISDTNIGGAGRLLLSYLKHRDTKRFDVSVALPSGSLLTPRLAALGVPVYELDAMRDKSFDPGAVRKLRRVIARARPDIVHTHGSLSGRIAAKRCGARVVFTRHSAFPPSPRFTKGVGRRIFKLVNERYADRIIAVSPVCRDDLTACGIDPARIDAVMNGTEPAAIPGPDARAALRARFGIAPGEFAAGIAARLEPYKGHMYILEAAGLLKARGVPLRVLIAGTGSFEDELRKRADELGLSGSAVFLGFVPDTEAFFGALDVQLNASTIEATSMSLIEGMSMGLPAIASRDGGNPWVIEDGVNGLLFTSRDARELADCIARLYGDAVLRERLRAGALEVYGRRFTAEILAKAIENTYIRTMEDTAHGKQQAETEI